MSDGFVDSVLLSNVPFYPLTVSFLFNVSVEKSCVTTD